jgi:transposase-like protein
LVNPAVKRRFCPKCHSENIILWMGGYTGAMYRCPDCGYTGPIVIETNDPIPSEESETDGED